MGLEHCIRYSDGGVSEHVTNAKNGKIHCIRYSDGGVSEQKLPSNCERGH